METGHDPLSAARCDEMGTMTQELRAAANAVLVILGDKLGLYRELAADALTSKELAERTGIHECRVREWLAMQRFCGFVACDTTTGRYRLTDQASVITILSM